MIVNDFRHVFASSDLASKVDLILTPTCFHDTNTYASHLKEEQVFDEKDFFTAIANIAGLPAISVPARLSAQEQMPVGVQLISNWNSDALLLNTANWFIRKNMNNYPYQEDFF